MEEIKELLVNKDIQCELKDWEYKFWINDKQTVSYKGTKEQCIERLQEIESNFK